jgi:hypothetical protein
MNLKLKAGIDVVVAVVGFAFVGFVARQILQLLSATYGTQNVIDGILFVVCLVGMTFTAYMLYRIRVSDLEYRAKLNQMIKK